MQVFYIRVINLYYNVKCLLQYLLKWRVPLRVSKLKFVFDVFS